MDDTLRLVKHTLTTNYTKKICVNRCLSFWPLCCLSFFDLRILITPFGYLRFTYSDYPFGYLQALLDNNKQKHL